MNTFFYNTSHLGADHGPSIDSSKECTLFMPTVAVEDKEMHSIKTPEQASAIIEKRMAKAIEEEFSRLMLEI